MDDIQPTARWANRMLRPLTSIYRRLEKHHETLATIAVDSRIKAEIEDIDKHTPPIAEPVNTRDTLSGSDADEDDPVWIPGKKPEQRRNKHNYSGRGQGKGGRKRTRLSINSPEAPRTLPGAIELATPLITGKRWEIPSSARSQFSIERRNEVHRKGQQQAFRDRYSLHKSPWQTLLDQSDSGFADIAHNLDRVLQNFLCNTRVVQRGTNGTLAKPERGARSLLSMVARSLPEFIAREQDAQNDMEHDGEEDMYDAYYTELESFYAPHGRGWKPLREAVRAQGIHMVSTMIQNKWVTDPIACALVEKCGPNELDACESLLSTFLSTRTKYHYPLALKSDTEPRIGDPILLLRKYTRYGSASRSFIFDELAKLLIRGVLPPEWMATKHWNSWMTRATISFSKGDSDCAAASQLIEAVLVSASDIRPAPEAPNPKRRLRAKLRATGGRATRASFGGPASKVETIRPCPVPIEDALSNHITSLLAALCGMHISRSRDLEDVESFDGTKAGHIINYLSFNLEKDMALRPMSHVINLTSHQLFRRGCILLANCLLQCNDAALTGVSPCMMISNPRLDKHCDMLASRADLVKELALFVRQAFRCFGSATDNERLYTAQEIRRIISQFPRLAQASSLSALLCQVAIESAMGFAEGTGEPDDHVWAVEIQETVIALRNGRESSPESTDESDEQGLRRGYRWEESIGEWVARTPAAKSNPGPSVVVRRRTSLALPMLCNPCSTDSSSPESDRFEGPASSLTSSPSSAGTKRDYGEFDSSPLRPVRSRPSARGIVIANSEERSCGARSSSPDIDIRSPSLEPVPHERRILRDVSNQNTIPRATPKSLKRPSAVEVVIFNKKQARTSDQTSQFSSEPHQKQVHRAVERRRSGPPRISNIPAAAQRRSIIPCSEDDSDDELSFI
ncbi:hypothetical protein N7448_006652 [Penicillium atrosanguineum]|uniref:Uncharacterized protein n=1 Tax=Penicillium atrosanguineum TaxID=1132637 RepID=A0A9W9GYQ2_9EURO|nr:uncharacterized protein N7443_010413 [Penicillium atrosanguineum]KAJ5132494.1 hypothetical protein N7448_006652 [Penicillium atrosanguineum]KAJ5137293.1 hypothetical protein N7526_003526 [Penicillium atrosanguineum]KAJ5290160.1 hypothetical protein N7443_010413 [Penicillium atrosanguineum]KAJ5307984.1 hypothetical protein N7476_008640 [Penicillium atrosanguineum]